MDKIMRMGGADNNKTLQKALGNLKTGIMRAQVKIPQNEWKVKLKKYLRTRTNTKEGKIGKERAVQKD